MFKLVVLSALLAVCAARPGNLGIGLAGHGGLALGGYAAAPAVAVPSAVSSGYRTDIIRPVAAVVRTAVAAPVAVAAPALAIGGHGLGLGGIGLGGLGLGLGHGW